MNMNVRKGQELDFQNTSKDDPKPRGGGDAGTSDTDDEEVLQNDTDIPLDDDLEDLDLDADMLEDDGTSDEDDDELSPGKTEGTQ